MSLAVVAAVGLLSAGALPARAAGAPATPASPHGGVDGVWRMDGYGTVLSIADGHLQQYDTTDISCLEGYAAAQVPADRHGGPVRFRRSDGMTLTVTPGSAGRAQWDYAGYPGYRALRRIPSLPATCAQVPRSDAVTVFDIVWRTYAENYPFFAVKGVDWPATGERYRRLIRPDTGDADLFDVLTRMIRPLHDAHTVLVARDRVFQGVRPGTVLPDEALEAKVKAFVNRRDLSGALRDHARQMIGYADLPDRLGYLRIAAFTGYAGPDVDDSVELDNVLDEIFSPARTSGPAALRGLIIDVRVNGGGSDALGLQIASRLTDRPYPAYARRARNDPQNATRFTPAQPIVVRPAPAPRYVGPIAVLTGGSTVSAAETFTQALINRPGRAVRIGQPTQGVFSDVMGVTLPNGWWMALPNEQLATDGRTFDGGGLPPHLVTPVFTEEEWRHDRDSAFDVARGLLTGSTRGATS